MINTNISISYHPPVDMLSILDKNHFDSYADIPGSAGSMIIPAKVGNKSCNCSRECFHLYMHLVTRSIKPLNTLKGFTKIFSTCESQCPSDHQALVATFIVILIKTDCGFMI